MRTYTPVGGRRVVQAARDVVNIAQKTGRLVALRFNDVEVIVRPGDTVDDVVHAYYKDHYKNRS